MQTVTRRDFLGATALTGIGVLTADGAWALNKQDGTAYAVEDGGTVVHKRLP